MSTEFRLKTGLADMLKGGAIMDVTNAEQAGSPKSAGAVSVMALERVPADIGGTAGWPGCPRPKRSPRSWRR